MITANELKTKGIKAIDQGLKGRKETAISVRGQIKYVVMTVEQFDTMREAELEIAYQEMKKDLKNKKYHTSIEKHFKDIDSALLNG